jgi:hypothetical protein
MALRREQLEPLEINYQDNQAMGKEGETDCWHHVQRPREKKKERYACGLLMINSLKEGSMWLIHLVLGNNSQACNYVPVVTEYRLCKQRMLLGNDSYK